MPFFVSRGPRYVDKMSLPRSAGELSNISKYQHGIRENVKRNSLAQHELQVLVESVRVVEAGA